MPPAAVLRIAFDRDGVLRTPGGLPGVDLDQRAGFIERLGDRHPPAGAGHRPRRSHAVYEGSIVIWVLHVDEAAGAAGGLLSIEQGEKE